MHTRQCLVILIAGFENRHNLGRRLAGVDELRLVADSDGSNNCDSASYGDLKVCRESDDRCSFDAVLPVRPSMQKSHAETRAESAVGISSCFNTDRGVPLDAFI
eukprot:SAG11_NODE_4248_length_1987_cov_1.788136_2_plen_104_part_00